MTVRWFRTACCGAVAVVAEEWEEAMAVLIYPAAAGEFGLVDPVAHFGLL